MDCPPGEGLALAVRLVEVTVKVLAILLVALVIMAMLLPALRRRRS